MPRWLALAIVLLVLIAGSALVIISETVSPVSSPRSEQMDADAYLGVLALMRGGSSYYHAAHEVLLAKGYGTTSVFNWRTPAWPKLIAFFPSIVWVQVSLTILASITLLFAYRMVRARANFLIASAVVLGIVPSLVLITAAKGLVLTEVVAGTLILSSIVGYGHRNWIVGLAAALLALFIRELAAPYILLCIGFAVWQRNSRELVGWVLGLLAYFVYFAWHWTEVAQRLGSVERDDPGGWIRFGGIRFVIETAHFNGLFFLTPLWLTAALLPAALMGLFAWRQGLRAALTVTVYLCTFSVIGKPFNFYWGALYAPLLMLGLPWSVPALYDALATLRSDDPD